MLGVDQKNSVSQYRQTYGPEKQCGTTVDQCVPHWLSRVSGRWLVMVLAAPPIVQGRISRCIFSENMTQCWYPSWQWMFRGQNFEYPSGGTCSNGIVEGTTHLNVSAGVYHSLDQWVGFGSVQEIFLHRQHTVGLTVQTTRSSVTLVWHPAYQVSP